MTMVLVIFLIFTLIGCSGIEPEKRRYPLAMGVDWADGQFQVYYGMPDLPASTGQDKQEEGGDTSVLSFPARRLSRYSRHMTGLRTSIWIWDIWKR